MPTIATWNVNGLRARLAFLRHWLQARQPDVVGLQELKLPAEQFPYDELAELGYQALVHGQKAWNGVAVLSREPAESVQVGLPGQEAAGARLLTARVSGIHFTTVYVPNGKTLRHPDFPQKLDWLDALSAHFRAAGLAEVPAVLCGDFNLCPGALDSWDAEGLAGEIFHSTAERSRFAALLEGGFVDLYRDFAPDGRAFSWWDYRGGAFHKGQGLRIDLLLGTEPVRKRVVEVRIDRDYRKKKDGLIASDHAPVIAVLD